MTDIDNQSNATRLTIGAVASFLDKSRSSSGFALDLRHYESVSFAAASMLYAWATENAASGISLILPPRQALPHDLKTALFESNFAARLATDSDVHLPYAPDVTTDDEFAVSAITDLDHLNVKLRAVEARLLSSGVFRPSLASELCETLLYELLENALIHAAGSRNYLAFKLGRCDSIHDDPALAKFSRGAAYLDVALGDFGPGITTRLRKLMPRAYLPGLSSPRKYTRPERVLAYAFEFLSTSDEPARKRRLAGLLSDTKVDPLQVSTGLSCVLNVMQRLGAQIIVRTPDAVLSVDYSLGSPRVRGSVELQLPGSLGPSGTHIFLRVPAVPHALPRGTISPFPQSDLLEHVSIIAPFANAGRREPDALHDAIRSTERHMHTARHSEGLTIIAPVESFVSSRARAIFGAFLASVNRGRRHLICADDYFAALPPSTPPRAYTPAVESGAIIVGDLVLNRYAAATHAGVSPPPYLAPPSNSESLQLAPRVHDVVITAYTRFLADQVARELQRPGVKLEPGPFLIENTYYTTQFFNVATILSDPRCAAIVAEWLFLNTPRSAQGYFVASHTLHALVRTAATLFETRYGRSMDIFGPPESGGTAGAHIGDRTLVIVTDVVCRGDALRAAVRHIPADRLTRIVALVDARDANAASNSLSVGDVAVPITSTLRSPVRVYAELPLVSAGDVLDLDDIDRTHDDPDERIYLVDRHTHQPTLYVRPLRGHADRRTLLDAAARAEALRYGHVEHQRRHYSVFLHLPRLFQSLRAEILAWVEGQAEFVARVQSPAEPWRVALVDTDGSLSWLQQELVRTIRPVSIDLLSWDLLRAPSPVTNAELGGNWLILVPASASGEVIRRSVEFASRRRPSSILVLVVVSRIERSHQSFLMRISRYGSSPVRIAFFAEFTVRAYPADGVTCPMCHEAARLEILTRLPIDVSSDIARVLRERLTETRYAPLTDDTGTTAFTGTSIDVERAHLRALYESAEHSMRSRRELQHALESDVNAVDRVLEILAAERAIQHFAPSELRARLGAAFDILMQRVEEILWREVPPCPLRMLLRAVVHLDEAGFVQAAPRLATAFAASAHDIEELCINLLLTGHRLAGEGDVLEAIASSPAAVRLLVQTRELLDEQQRRASQQRHVISAWERLWSRFARSSQFMDSVKRLAWGDYVRDADEAYGVVNGILDAWNSEIMPLWAEVATSELWPAISSRHADLAQTLTALTATVTDLRLYASRSFAAAPDDVADQATNLGLALERMAGHAARELLSRLFCSVVNVVGDAVPLVIQLSDGYIVTVRRDVDYRVPPTFCCFDEYARVLAQLVDNWAVYGAGAGARVGVRVFRDSDMVVTELTDNFPGEIQEDSEGGIRMARELCAAYGGHLELRPADQVGEKAVRMSFNVLGLIEEKRLPNVKR